MKHKILGFVLALFATVGTLKAQNENPLTLAEAVHLALTQSNHAKIASTQVEVAKNQWRAAKNKRYPDVSIGGQYLYLTKADIDIELPVQNNAGNSGGGIPDIHQLLIGQASVSVPVFAGFKIKNSIEAAAHTYQAEDFLQAFEQGKIILYTIQNYIQLYKAQQTVRLVKENLKTAEQRLSDFKALEKNGLLARNDLLKAELQKSNVELTLAEAKKNIYMANYRLVVFLGLPKGTQVQVNKLHRDILLLPATDIALTRGDLQAMAYRVKAAKDKVQIAKGNYFPSISLSAGYMALDIENALSVTNAINFGVGISYDVAGIFKNKREVELAKSQMKLLQYSYDKRSDKASIELKNTFENYQLAIKKLHVYQTSEAQAVENYRIVKDKYENGLQDTKDLLEADVQQLKSKIELAYAQADIVYAYYAWQQAQGNLVSQFNK